MSSRIGMGALATAALVVNSISAGDLDPPGAPAPTDPIEPRIAINQENTPGDAEAHFLITESGSYFLPSGFTASNLSTRNGIVVEASDVTIDLNGFTLDGFSVPAIGPLGFFSNDTLTGIRASGDIENITIRNGVVRDWGQSGCSTFEATNSLIEDLIVYDCDSFGIQTGFSAVVRGCIAASNSIGITTRGSCTVLDSFARENSGVGILSGSGNIVSRCAAANNGSDGIVLNGGSSVLDCTAEGNDGVGIRAFGGCIVSRCTAHFNDGIGIEVFSGSASVIDCNANFNLGDGICVTSDCRVENNTCNLNGRGGQTSVAGILATSSDNRIDGNTVTNNARGIEATSAGNLIVRNSASGNSPNYDIVAGNDTGTIQATPVGAGPWDNFSF